jgi:DNA-binding NtrC family response regulator
VKKVTKILVVDDEQAIMDLIEMILKREQFEVIGVAAIMDDTTLLHKLKTIDKYKTS